MLHVQPIGSESAYYRLENVFSWLENSSLDVILLKRGRRGSIDYGLPPITGTRNSVGDRNCRHTNICGSIELAEEPNVRTHDIVLGIPNYSPITIFCPSRVIGHDDWMLIEFGKSYSYQLEATDWQIVGSSSNRRSSIQMQIQSTENHILATSSWYEESWYKGTRIRYKLKSARLEVTLGTAPVSGESIRYDGSSYSYVLSSGTSASNQTWSPMFTRCVEPSMTEAQIVNSITAFLEPVIHAYCPMSEDIIAEVALDAVNNCHVVDLNMLAFGIDVKNIRRLGSALKSIVEIRDTKSLANAYLSNNYGTKLFLSDAITLISTITKHRKKTLFRGMSMAHARSSDSLPITRGPMTGYQWERQCNLKLYYSPYDTAMKNLVQRLYDTDVYPSYQNLWDLIPYSFVIDWFVDIDGWLDARDAENYLEKIETKSVCISLRDSINDIPAEMISSSLRGVFNVVIYHRWNQPVLPEMPTSLSLMPISNFNHWWEGAALIRQRIR